MKPDNRIEQNESRLRVGPSFEDNDLVFVQSTGKPYEPVYISHQFPKLVQNAELGKLRFHDLRHTAATLMLLANVHPKVVSERLGHASVQITLDLYSHGLPSLQKEAATVVDSVLEPGLAVGG